MNAFLLVLNGLTRLNSGLIRLGKSLAWICVSLMVGAILLQVFMRYGLNNALPWPEEAARALMIWMMALTAAAAYRQGGFVAIEMLQDFLPRIAARLLRLVLLVCALLVLIKLFTLGIDYFERGFRTRAASFNLPRAWIYLAMPVCFGSMLLVNLELLLCEAGRLCLRNFDDHYHGTHHQGARPAE